MKYLIIVSIILFNSLLSIGLDGLIIPISSMHYLMTKKNAKAISDDTDHHEDVL